MNQNRLELGKTLKELRGRCKDPSINLSKRVIESIETGSSQYPVKKLLEYLDGIQRHATIHIVLVDESIEINTPLDFHKAIARMLDVYGENPYSISMKISIFYTPPKENNASLSIDTLLAILNFCDSELIIE